ncbi:MAG: cupin domain-containing protein [Candidatus Pacebacteria bacterium]|nr:cupin domain-containing protein [Candidatus Paceibacterota bacterium]
MKKGYKGNIEKLTEENNNFRHVLYTGEHSQLVLMTLQVGEEIGEETHTENDQFFRFESGTGKVIINETTYEVGAGDAVIIPVGAKHNIVNVGDTLLKMYTIYAPAHHKDGVIRSTKKEAENDSPEFDGITTE